MAEDMNAICRMLSSALKETDYYKGRLLSLKYDNVSDYCQIVKARFINDVEKDINVTFDSGAAMIRDVIEQLKCGE